MELEGRAALAARIERVQRSERESARESRERALATIGGSGPSPQQAEQRTMEWMNVESAVGRERQLEPLARAAAERVAVGREQYFARRKERMQVESVLEAERARLRIEQERRAQRDLDDWFGMKLIRERIKSESLPRS